jgi:hypothetical protein
MLTIERVGGFAGFGGPGSRIRSRGSYPFEKLSPTDQAKVENWFRSRGQSAAGPPIPDAFRYRITRDTPNGQETVEVPESAVPPVLRDSVKDELQ